MLRAALVFLTATVALAAGMNPEPAPPSAAPVSLISPRLAPEPAGRSVSPPEKRKTWKPRPALKVAPKPVQPRPVAPVTTHSGYSGMGSGGCGTGYVYGLIQTYFPSSQWGTAVYICNRESGGNPNAYNHTYVAPYGNASGLFQILYPGIWQGWEKACGIYGSVFDAVVNVRIAACHVRMAGWGAWAI